ncbi:MAG: methyltransferase [Symploca sp. SIO2E9]|nr:methyltransferase [Symploca sp. SIO2E9]
MHLQDPTAKSNPIPPQMTMMQMASGYFVSQSIYVAAKLGIADLLKDSQLHCDALAAATDTHSDSLYRILRLLASVGIFAETEPRCFELTPLAACLQSDIPDSIRAFTIMLGEEHYQACGNLMHSIKTGECAFNNSYGINIFEYLQQNPSSAQIFDQAMTQLSVAENSAVLAAYDFSSIGKLVDIGGGNGALLAAILQTQPSMSGVLFELPDVINRAKDVLEKAGVSKRTQLVGGSFLETIPAGGDAYMLKHIAHNWDDEQVISILKRTHQAMPQDGRLLVMEPVIPPGNEPFFGKLLDIVMLVVSPSGRERTEAKYQELFKLAGFKLTKIFPTPSDISVIEGVKLSTP